MEHHTEKAYVSTRFDKRADSAACVFGKPVQSMRSGTVSTTFVLQIENGTSHRKRICVNKVGLIT